MNMATKNFVLKGKNRDSYLELILAFPLASISSETHLKQAQKVLDHLLSKSILDNGEEIYLDALSDLVGVYEDDHYPIEPPSDADMLRHLLESKGITQAKLSQETQIAKSTISEILAGKKPFSRHIIRKLANYFQVDISILTRNL
jgi:HTH-type transcriptional regulator/antitoxin HigA